MKSQFLKIFASAITLMAVGLTASAQDSITMADIWLKGTFNAKGVYGYQPLANGKDYLRKLNTSTEIEALISFGYQDGKAVDTLFRTNYPTLAAASADNYSFDGYGLSKDENLLLLQSETESIYRHSSKAKVHIWNRTTSEMYLVDADKIMYPTFSPDGKYLSFVKNNNLFLYAIEKGTTTAITTDGKVNAIINGGVDWVYEEEFSMSVGYQWSPDSRYIAYYRFDESAVPEFSMDIFDGLYPKQDRFKYPKAGEPNSLVNVHVYDITSGNGKALGLEASPDIYYPRILWTGESGMLSIQKLNRHQNHLELLLANVKTNATIKAWEDKSEWYVDITNDLHWLNGGKNFIISSERNGFNHIFHFDKNGKLLKQITTGPEEVISITGVDEKTKWVYYQRFGKSPSIKQLCRSSFDGKKTEVLSANETGIASLNYNSTFNYALKSISTFGKPPLYSIVDGQGKLIRTLEDNSKLNQKLEKTLLGNTDFIKIQGALEELYAWIITPPNMEAGKKYPVLMYVYGGPGSQTVLDAWGGANYLWFQMLAQKGYIVVSVDNTGTGGRGAQFKKKTYLNLGIKESDDQIAAAMWLMKNPWVDSSRIGIWGWSYGGFMSALSLGRGNGIFKSAIAVAPVTDWRFYDNIYTERYMRTPKENEAGYNQTKPAKYLNSTSGKLLLIHGTADDNVHFQNSVELVKALIESSANFDSEFYPNKNHGIGGAKTRYQLFNRMTNFLLENL